VLQQPRDKMDQTDIGLIARVCLSRIFWFGCDWC